KHPALTLSTEVTALPPQLAHIGEVGVWYFTIIQCETVSRQSNHKSKLWHCSWA
ncbi:hypothetical protein J6590_091698, partial [Homalodisca vitripennis]